MLLDRDFFSSITLNEYRSRYYDISEVDALLVEIRRQADELNTRCCELQARLNEAETQADAWHEKAEGYRRKGIFLSKELVSLRNQLKELQDRPATHMDNNIRAEKFSPGDAENEDITGSLRAQQEYAIRKAETMFNSMKEIHASAIRQLNAQWQDFLAGLENPTEIPADLTQKVSSIAKELNEIEADDSLFS